jgi:hypothetical protein
MKPHTEMIEGPKALQNFEETMKALFSTRKSDVSGQKKKAHKAATGKRRATGEASKESSKIAHH